MAIGLMPHRGLCALWLVVCAGCSSGASGGSSGGGTQAGSGASSGGVGPGAPGGAKADDVQPGSSGAESEAGGVPAAAGGAGNSSDAGAGGSGPPAAVEGQSVYALECHGDSKDCNLASVPCFGVGTQTPGVAAGWACANRCSSDAECSDAPSGAEAQASCVSFTSASHCVLVCQNENQAFDCPGGMTCYTPPQSPIGYCLWQ